MHTTKFLKIIPFSAALLALGLWPSNDGFAQVIVEEINVTNDFGKGIKSLLIEITRDKSELDLDETDDNGFFNQRFECAKFHKIIARPSSGPYTDSYPQLCQISMQLLVGSPTVLYALKEEAAKAEVEGDMGAAALLYNEVYYRARNLEPTLAEEARIHAINFTAKALGVDNAITNDPDQKKRVPSKRLVKAIKKYQYLSGIKRTGRIDFNTLKKLSGKTVGQYIARFKK